MQIESKIIGIINDKLKNPIYETLRLLNMKTILTKSNFSKKEGVAVHMVVLHFVYMLVMNKKISTFMDQSNDSFKKEFEEMFKKESSITNNLIIKNSKKELSYKDYLILERFFMDLEIDPNYFICIDEYIEDFI